MKTFICTNGLIARCDAPALSGDALDVAAQLGFELLEADTGDHERFTCAVCRPKRDQDVFLTIHGIERNIYALVIWRQDERVSYIFAPTPFDLVTAVEHIARYEQAMRDLRQAATARDGRSIVTPPLDAPNGRVHYSSAPQP
jgi:hypothetical protein